MDKLKSPVDGGKSTGLRCYIGFIRPFDSGREKKEYRNHAAILPHPATPHNTFKSKPGTRFGLNCPRDSHSSRHVKQLSGRVNAGRLAVRRLGKEPSGTAELLRPGLSETCIAFKAAFLRVALGKLLLPAEPNTHNKTTNRVPS